MKKAKLLILPVLAMSALTLSSCTKDDISSLFELGDSLASVDNNLQSQIDDLKTEIAGLKEQITNLRQEMNEAETAIRSEYNQKISKINEDIAGLEQELADLTETFNIEKQALQADYTSKISNLKTYTDEKVADLNEQIAQEESALNALATKHEQDKQALQDDYVSRLSTLSSTIEQSISALRTEYNQKLATLESKHDADKQELFNDYTTKLAALSESEVEARATLKADYESKIETLEAKHDLDKQTIQNDYNTKLANLETPFNNGKTELQNDYNTKITNLNNSYSEAVTNLQNQITTNKNAVDAFKTQYTNEKAALELDYNTKISNLITTYEAKVAEIEASIQTNASAISSLETEMSNQIVSVQNDYNTKINALTTRVAALEEKTYHTVSFDSKCGTEIISVLVEHGEKVSKPADPTKPGFTFEGWTYLGEPWVFYGYVVTEDITLEANWEYIDYTVIFQNDDGTVLETQNEVHYGDTVIYHGEIPIKPNPIDHYIYTFNGWDVDVSNITGNTIAVAQYSAEYAPYTAYFVDDNDNILYQTLVREGETASYVGEEPTKADDNVLQLQYQFVNWEEVGRTTDTITYKTHFESCTKGLVFDGDSVYQYIGTATSVTIPARWNGQTINEISNGAFEGTLIEEVVISSGIKYIKDGAFQGCSLLRSVSIPNSLISIGGENSYNNGAFQNCVQLEYIEIPNTVSVLGGSTFAGCTLLKSCNIPNSINKIDRYLFESCASLENITIPDNITSIKMGAFGSCHSLKSVVIPSSVTTIEGNAFWNCLGLEYAFIPSTVINIGANAFGYDCKLTTICCENSFKPKSWELYWNGDCYVAWNCEYVTSLEGYTYALALSDGVKSAYLISYDKTIEHFETPEVIMDDYPLVYINPYMFRENAVIKSIKLPLCVTALPELCFSYCSSLSTVELTKNVVEIGRYAFNYCESLVSIHIPDSVSLLGEGAFYHCTSLESFTGGKGLTEIPGNGFCSCSSLEFIEISEGVTTIGGSSFFECTRLRCVVIPSSITLIQSFAFYNVGSPKILFGGTEEQWNQVEFIIDYYFYGVTYYYSELTPSESGNYWHYCLGIPVVWGDESLNDVIGYNSSNRDKTYLCNLVASLYLEKGLENWGSSYNIVFGGGYLSCRSPYYLYEGDVSYSYLESLFPFENEIVLCSVSGYNLYNKFINSSNENYYCSYSEYGDSIKETIDNDATYYIVVDSYTAGYAPNGCTVIDTLMPHYFARDLLADYVKNGLLN